MNVYIYTHAPVYTDIHTYTHLHTHIHAHGCLNVNSCWYFIICGMIYLAFMYVIRVHANFVVVHEKKVILSFRLKIEAIHRNRPKFRRLVPLDSCKCMF